MSSSEVQRITLSAKKIVSPNGSLDLEEWEDEEEDEKADKTEDGDENTTMEATTPLSESAANKGSFKFKRSFGLDLSCSPFLSHGAKSAHQVSPLISLFMYPL